MMVSPVEHQMTVESPTNGQPPAAANSAERDSLPTVEQREMDHLRADGATFGSVVATLAPTYLEPQVMPGMAGGQVSINGSAVQQ